METRVDTYISFPLPGPRHIRVCDVLPDEDDRPLRVQLRVISLDSNADFDALSYVWGSPGPEMQMTVLVNARETRVPRNLHDCLRVLRRTTRTTALWVDAICINQSHMEEKNTTVPLMPEIYRRAKRTFASVRSPLSPPALQLITDLERFHDQAISRSSLVTEPCIYHSNVKISANLVKSFASNNESQDLEAWTNLNDFLNDTYFTRHVEYPQHVWKDAPTHTRNVDLLTFRGRIWIRPDMVHSNNMLFLETSFTHRRYVWRIPSSTFSLLSFETLRKALEVALLLSSSQTCRITSPGILAVVTCGYLGRRLHCAPESRPKPSEVLLAQQNCQGVTSYNSDQIFAFLPMMEPSRLSDFIASDYSADFEEVSIKASSIIGPLCLSLAPSAKSLASWPSWVVEWTQPQQRFLLNHTDAHFNCDSIQPVQEETNDDRGSQEIFLSSRKIEKSLQMACVAIDEVLEVSSYLPPRRHYDHYNVSGANIVVFDEWLDFVKERLAKFSRQSSKEADVLLHYADTIQARGCNSIWEASPMADDNEVVASTKKFLDFIAEENPKISWDVQLFYAACYPSHGRSLGVTRKGHFCLLPKESRRGDGIFVPRGNRVPVVFRKVGGQRYRNLGEAYVHGLMNAEAVRRNSDVETDVSII